MRSESKTWGPFTGRQLTTIICVTLVTLLLPVAAWSAVASRVVVDSGKITVAAPVAANVGQRSQFISSGTVKNVPSAGNGVVLITPPAGKGLVITHFTVAAYNATAGQFVHMFVGNPTTCDAESFSYELVFAAGYSNEGGTIVPGYVVPPGKVLCAHGSGTGALWAQAYGYIVAPGDARNPNLAAGAGAATPNVEHR